jgi:hypothetical protein
VEKVKSAFATVFAINPDLHYPAVVDAKIQTELKNVARPRIEVLKHLE